MFINGDIVDNVVLNSDKTPVTGTLSNWQKDVREYISAREILDDIPFHGSLGPGHDFSNEISMERAGKCLCSPRGSFSFNGFDFVWLSGKVHAFSNEPASREESFARDDLLWLENELAGKDHVVLMFHVPLTTEETIRHGAWPGNRSITIPTEDKIYAVIDRHLDTIKMIFNGHIHGFIASDYKGIPLKIATFYNKGHYCKICVHDETLDVTVLTYPSAGS